MPQRYEFSEMNSDRDSMSMIKGSGGDRGCYVKIVTGFIMVLLALVIAVGAGLIVHFVENRKLECVYADLNGNVGANIANQIGNQPTTKPTDAPVMTSPTTLAATSSATPPIDFRLPRNFQPIEYTLRIQPNMYEGDPKQYTFSGRVEIKINCAMASKEVVLHMNKINVTSMTFSQTSGSGTAPKYVSHDEDKGRQFLLVHLDRETTPGSVYTLTIEYVGPLVNDMRGLYLTTYKHEGKMMYAATTQFEATDARKAFPCFDEPSMKAIFKVTLVRKKHQMSLSNMPVMNSRNIANDLVEDIYHPSVKMSTYLLAFVIGEFSSTTTRLTSTNVAYNVWSRPTLTSQLQQALNDGINILPFYETYFDIKFPLPKQDMIAIPDFRAGAMENWGLITYRESSMLYDEHGSPAKSRQRITTTVTHEIAHEWFGDLVTMSWWDDIWLNEGFATFIEFFGADHLYPEWKMLDQFIVDMTHVVFDLDALKSSHPIYFPVNSPGEINQAFDWISYNKGAAVIRMMKFFLGDETFRKGLNRYLSKLAYKNAFHDDLWDAMTQQAKEDHKTLNVTDIMSRWILQMNYPVVTVKRNVDTVTLTQRRFLMDETSEQTDRPSPYGYKWSIPFTFTTSLSPNFNVTNNDIQWLTDTTLNIPLSGLSNEDWFIGNLNQEGYYRVNYDDQNWMALIKQLKTKHDVISPVNRAQIINDAWSLSRSGHLSTTIALQTLEYLSKEMDYVPWVAALKQIHFADDMLSKSPAYGKLRDFVKTTINKPFKHYGMDDTKSSHIDSLTRDKLSKAACMYEVETCVLTSQSLYTQWMDNPENNPIAANLRSAVYCAAIASGGIVEWEFMLAMFTKLHLPSDTYLMLNALGCTKSPWIISRYLELTLNDTVIRKQDIVVALSSIASTPTGALLAWDFVRTRWDFIFNKYGKGQVSMRRLLPALTKTFNTELQLQQLEAVLADNPDLGSTARPLEQAIENTKSNIKWMQQNEKVVSDWLSLVGVTATARFTDVRLPVHLNPISYDLTIKPYMYGEDSSNFTFEGSVKIVMEAKESARNVTLHVNKLDIVEDSIKFGRTDGQPSPSYKGRSSDKLRQFEIFQLDGSIIKGLQYYIQMDFSAPLVQDLAGFYLSQYKQGNRTVYIASTQFESTDARKAFPCFDEPNLKATFKVTLIRKPSITTISNMPIMVSENLPGGFIADKYNTSARMSTYLLAFVFSEFEYKEDHTSRGIRYRAWSRPDSINQTDVALETGVKIISYYEDYFNISFPLPKQDMIAIPDFALGAMENWGLITYRETAMLYEPGVSSEHNLQLVLVDIAHELAHQWFGNLVTIAWWDDLWLNEGFATFVEYMGADHVSPNWKIFEQFVFELYEVFERDDKVTSHPILVPVYTPEEISEIFDTISYAKGGSVIRMMRFFLGEQTFQKGLQRYLKSLKYSNAVHGDLWRNLQMQADSESKNIKIKDIMDTWILQMNFPVVTISRNTSGEILVQQDRFLTDRTAKDTGRFVSPFDYVWKIPFTYTTKGNANFDQTDTNVTWINEKSQVIPDTSNSNDWILGNIKQYGVYRVNYEEDNWLKLIQQLKTDFNVIHFINRGQLIHDAFGLAKAKMLPMEIALKTLEYLQFEDDYIPWAAAGGEIAYINDMISDTEIYGKFQDFMVKTVSPLFKTLTMDFTGSQHIDIYLRSSMISKACGYGVKECIQNATDLFREYMNNPDVNPIDSQMKSAVYCTAVENGGKEEWEFIFNLYMNAKVQTERARLMSTLSCTRQIWLLNKLLNYAMDQSIIRMQDVSTVFGNVGSNPVGKFVAWDFFRSNFAKIYEQLLNLAMDQSVIRKQDVDTVFRDVGSNPVGKFVAWDFFRSNFPKIYEEYGTGFLALTRIIRGITSNFNTEVQLQQLEDFRRVTPDLGSGTRAFEQAIESTRNNIRWMEDNYDVVDKWLDEQKL